MIFVFFNYIGFNPPKYNFIEIGTWIFQYFSFRFLFSIFFLLSSLFNSVFCCWNFIAITVSILTFFIFSNTIQCGLEYKKIIKYFYSIVFKQIYNSELVLPLLLVEPEFENKLPTSGNNYQEKNYTYPNPWSC